MQSQEALQLAIIGSGPAGCYLAQTLARELPSAAITVFDALPTPFGLVRYGVAADHQHTKAISQQFARVFADPRVRFAGNVCIGDAAGDLALETLSSAFDAVVLATGLAADRTLSLPGADLPGVYGAGSIIGTLNSLPGAQPMLPELGSDVVIIGGGNVAIDLLRFLVKDPGDYGGSDIADAALDGYAAHPATNVTVLIRSSPARSKGDPQMIKELADLRGGSFSSPDIDLTLSGTDETTHADDRAAVARVAAFRQLVSTARATSGLPHVSLRFGATPVRVLGDTHVTGVEFTANGGAERVAAQSVLTAIGFTASDGLLARTLTAHAAPRSSGTGRIAPRLYRAGWAQTGPVGAIPSNRASAKAVAAEILADIASGALAPSGAPGFAGLPAAIQDRAVSFGQWHTIDAHERATARPDRVRQKLTETDHMIAIARGDAHTEGNTPA